jgi:hypothetical protein
VEEKIDIIQREDLKSVIVFETFEKAVGEYVTADGRTTGRAFESGVKAWVFSFPDLQLVAMFTTLGSPPKKISVGVDPKGMPHGGAKGDASRAMVELLSNHCTNRRFDDDDLWLSWLTDPKQERR